MNPQAQINFNVIQEAFDMMKTRWQPFVLATLLAYVVFFIGYFVVAIVLGGVMAAVGNMFGDAAALASIPLMFVMGFVIAALGAGVFGGLVKMAFKAWRGEEVSAGDVTSGFQQFGPLAVGVIIVYLATFIGYILCILPGLLIAGLSMFTIPLIVDKKMAPMDAFKTSIEMLKPQMWMALGFAIVLSIVAQIGGIACGVGALFTIPLALCAMVRQYMIFSGEATAPAAASLTPYPRDASTPVAETPAEPAPPSDPPAQS